MGSEAAGQTAEKGGGGQTGRERERGREGKERVHP